MHCHKRHNPTPKQESVEVKAGKEQKGNGVAEFHDKHGMEYKPMPPTKLTKGKIVEWKK